MQPTETTAESPHLATQSNFPEHGSATFAICIQLLAKVSALELMPGRPLPEAGTRFFKVNQSRFLSLPASRKKKGELSTAGVSSGSLFFFFFFFLPLFVGSTYCSRTLPSGRGFFVWVCVSVQVHTTPRAGCNPLSSCDRVASLSDVRGRLSIFRIKD